MAFGSGNSPTPSAGDNASAGSGAANQGIDYGSNTDDQILDMGADDGAELEGADDSGNSDQGEQGEEFEVVDLNAEDGEQGDGAQDEEQDEGEQDGQEEQEGDENAEQQEEEQTPDASQDPAQLRQVFKAHPELRQAYYREQAYREVFPQMAEARQYKEMLPTLEDVQTAVAARDDLAEFDASFYEPGKEAEFIGRLAQTDQEAFTRIAAAFPTALYQLNAQAYREQIAVPTITNALANLMNLAAQKGEGGTNLRNAVEVISMALFQGKRFAEVQQGRAEMTQRQPHPAELKLQQMQQEQAQAAFSTFHSGANEIALKGIEHAITGQLTGDSKLKIPGLLKGTALANNETAIRKIGTEIWQQINANLTGNKGLAQMLRNEFKAARQAGYTKDAQGKIAQILISKAKLLLPKVAAKVVGEYTQLTIGSNERRLQTAQRAAKRVDVTGSAGGGKPQGVARPRVSARNLDYSRTSDDDILSGKVTVRKR